jgi:pimeloyl-ACP methyl ester carboxylesterase
VKKRLSAFGLLAATMVMTAPAAAAPPRRAVTSGMACASGLPAGTRCGTVTVPEDRRNPARRSIALHYAVVPGEAPGTHAPLFLIAGGPGQSAISLAPHVLADIRSIDVRGDIVFLDQRGTGLSNPLTCPDGFSLLVRGGEERVGACIASLAARASPEHYGTRDAVQDLDEVRHALGYRSVNLMAVSYGVRVGLAYMRDHPRQVRAAILRAAAPLDFNIIGDGLRNADAEFEHVIADCAADPVCSTDFPQLRQQLDELQRRLNVEPVMVPAPQGAAAGQDILVTPELFQQFLYALLLTASTRQQIPLLVTIAATTGFEPLAPTLRAVRDQLYGALPIGMYLSVLCAEDAPRVRPNAFAGRVGGIAAMGPVLMRLCATWPHVPVDQGFHRQFDTRIPTLIISGERDPATTVAAAGQLQSSLSRSYHAVVPATSHGPLLPQCVRPMAASLIESGAIPDLRVDCSAVAMPPFARRPAPARAASPSG